MSVRIRLQRRGAHKRPFYHIVVADIRTPRDGKFLEKLGTYNPLLDPSEIHLKLDRYEEWVSKGAQPSESVADLARRCRESQPPAGEVQSEP